MDDSTDSERVISRHSEDVNLEHILPQQPSENWRHISPEDAEAFHKRIGNLTIIDSKLNVAAANASFPEKAKIYAKSRIEITSSLGQMTEWNIEDIEERQLALAKNAANVWKLQPS